MAKEIKYDMDARDLLKKGVDELANACLLYTSDAADE
mgnify:CR=1 FL=1